MYFVTLAERPEIRTAFRAVRQKRSPELLAHDPVSDHLFDRLEVEFADYQAALVDGHRILASISAIPFAWSAADTELPDEGRAFALVRGYADKEAGREPNVAAVLSVRVAPGGSRQNLGSMVVQGMCGLAAERGLSTLYAVVRPAWKDRYPLTPMTDYAMWTLPDGSTPFDPWLRVHWRVGGRPVRVCPRSSVITASVADWEEWTGLPMPASGQYVLPGAFTPVAVDVGRDLVTYFEPHLWIRHELRAGEPDTAAPG